MGKLVLNGFESAITYTSAQSLGKVFEAYAQDSADEDIMEIGFNANSGYVYIALENGITIASIYGNEVEYIVTDFESGEEFYLDSYDEAIEQLENLD